MKRKAIIVSAPSGAGKTTIVKHLLGMFPELEFSVSACSRPKREKETDGKDYYFITAEQFREKIAADEFIEWQEVYPGSYYGTLKSEMERIWSAGKTPIFDVDVLGGINLKNYFGSTALAVFIQPPSMQELEHRLRHRGSETEESLRIRLDKVEKELTYAGKFDRIIVNDEISTSSNKATVLITEFLNTEPQQPKE
ncbi:MAG: guanylate kinase [Bacteroidetes bacterium]|nr:guanylate kinase [Bacteroidota bacterium]